ncbi:hypothetical protein F8M41_010238 [Gigaspora margarita]|uniref:Transmembrane protein n=1 Tax=Gigaspora margarita TaxID=4874 RepID=A0A8H4AUG5_GIGMA|nr:hypothetical protein F8M41_010238 [Gigaspora margarita]
MFQEEKRACSLFWIKFTKYWFPPADDDYKNYDPPREPSCYRWTRFFSLLVIYILIIYFIIIFIMSFTDTPFLQMYRSNVNNIPIPALFLFFNTTIYSSFNINCLYTYSTGATSSCNSHIINSTESDIYIFAYYDPGVNFTDGTSLNMPTGVNFQISANNSFPNDTLTTLSSYPFMILVDQDLVTSLSNDPNSKSINSYAADTSNLFVLSPYQRQVVWFDRVKYSQLDAASRKGVLSVTKQSAKLAVNYFSLSTRIQSLSPLNPLGVNPSLFTATLEIYNQSSTLTTYKETDKASQFKVLTFLTSLGGANAFFVTFYMFLYGKKGPGMLPYIIYPFLCCSGPARYIRKNFIDQPPHMRDVEKEVDNIP